MSAWITDRLPTKDDAPSNVSGQVWMQGTGGELLMVSYHLVCDGTPWQPITYPEPYVRPKRWSIRTSASTGKPFLAKCGFHAIGLDPFTEPEQLAIVDALNRHAAFCARLDLALEEGV